MDNISFKGADIYYYKNKGVVEKPTLASTDLKKISRIKKVKIDDIQEVIRLTDNKNDYPYKFLLLKTKQGDHISITANLDKTAEIKVLNLKNYPNNGIIQWKVKGKLKRNDKIVKNIQIALANLIVEAKKWYANAAKDIRV